MAKKNKGFQPIWIAYIAVVVLFLALGIWMLKALLFSGEIKPKGQMTMVTLVKPPPPPPPPEEEPPPPEVEEEEIIEPEPQAQEDVAESSDEPPPGENLGVDAEGSAGGDGFGLVGKKGGRSLIGGDIGESSLLRKYAWYTRMLQDQIRREMRRVLEQSGGWPEGDNKAKVRIELDATGRIIDFKLVDSSGDDRMDRALLEVLPVLQLREPPPPDMPLAMYVKISARG
ncbi:MAG: energy transducer TonB [Syntrophotaleaceae bacterium]